MPPLRKTGCELRRAPRASCRGAATRPSRTTTGSPFFCGIGTGDDLRVERAARRSRRAAFFCDVERERVLLLARRSSTSRRRSPRSRPSSASGKRAAMLRVLEAPADASCRRSSAACGRRPRRSCCITNGARVMLSTPPAIDDARRRRPRRASRASLTASRPEPHRRFTVTAGTSYGRPASSAAMRATLRLSSPAWLVAPKTTWSTRAPAPRFASRIAPITCAARSSGRTSASAPLNLPIGVRTASIR